MNGRRIPLICATILVVGAAWWLAACSREVSWTIVHELIESTYPDVAAITTDSLGRFLASGEPPPILLDVRTPDEFAVSHLQGAIRVDPETEDFSVLDTLPRSSPIVTYCSVGYRSAALVSRLQEAGFSNVSNLRGSIFLWANEGRPVYRQDERVWEVHPYDDVWGRLLDPSLRAETPPAVLAAP